MFELVSGLQFSCAGSGTAKTAQLTFRDRTLSGASTDPNPFTIGPPGYESAPTSGPPNSIDIELAKVFDKIALRPDRLSEILTQVTNPYAYFSMVLNLQPGRHRYTYELMAMLFALTDKVVMEFKHCFRILRPADRSQLVQPVILTPSHGSYPAGHSVQSHLVALVLKALVTAAKDSDADVQLTRLADRISENRVVAGVHFPEDIEKGIPLGEALARYVLFAAGYTDADIANAVASPPLMVLAPSTVDGKAVNWLWRQAWAEWH